MSKYSLSFGHLSLSYMFVQPVYVVSGRGPANHATTRLLISLIGFILLWVW